MVYSIDFNNWASLNKIPRNVDSHRILHVKGQLLLDGATIIELRFAEKLNGKFITDWLVDSDTFIDEKDRTIQSFLKMGGNIYYVTNWNNADSFKSKLARYRFYYAFFKHTGYRVVYCDTDSPARVKLLSVAKLAGVPMRIIHSHNSKCEIGISNFNYHISRAMMPFILTDCLACSKLAAEWMFPRRMQGKVKIIANGLEANDWKYNPITRDRLRKELKLENAFVVGHVGRFAKQKNHERLISIFAEIYKRNDKSVLMLIGNGPLIDEIKAIVRKYGLENVVQFVGITDYVSDYMQAMDAFILPSRFEGLGMVGVEAQASGLPCFFSDTIPHEVGITDSVEFIQLEKSDSYWAEEVIRKSLSHKRVDTSTMIKNKGYDIETSAKIIESIIDGRN